MDLRGFYANRKDGCGQRFFLSHKIVVVFFPYRSLGQCIFHRYWEKNLIILPHTILSKEIKEKMLPDSNPPSEDDQVDNTTSSAPFVVLAQV